MDDIHFHLIINHFPIVGAIFSILVLLAGIFTRSEVVKRTAYGLFILTALLSLPTNKSGEDAEGHIKKVEGVNEVMIEKHEEMANIGFWCAIVTGLLAAIAFYLSIKENDMKGIVSILVLAAAIVSIIYLWQTGETGGKIRHTETYETPTE
ncbi:MAG: hypothetical protein ACKVQB_08500 [Bacteroidia bacterium]